MNKYEAEFSNIVRSFRKAHTGKGPSQVRTSFCRNWAICELKGNLSPIEKFIATSEEGKKTLRIARTEMIKQIYLEHPPKELEELLGAKFIHLFADIDIDLDIAMSVFVFDRDLEEELSK